jgi:hypothetical protein
MIKALAGVMVSLQMFLTLEPDEDEYSADFLLWKAPSVTFWSGCCGKDTM